MDSGLIGMSIPLATIGLVEWMNRKPKRPKRRPACLFHEARGCEFCRCPVGGPFSELSGLDEADTTQQRSDLAALRSAFDKGLPVALFEAYTEGILRGERLSALGEADLKTIGDDDVIQTLLGPLSADRSRPLSARAQRHHAMHERRERPDLMTVAEWQSSDPGIETWGILPHKIDTVTERADGWFDVTIRSAFGGHTRMLRKVRPKLPERHYFETLAAAQKRPIEMPANVTSLTDNLPGVRIESR